MSLLAGLLCLAEDPVVQELTSLETAKHAGTLDEAKKMLEKALELQKNKKYEEADNLFKKALLIYNQRLGDCNLYSAVCFQHLGVLSGMRSRVVEASWYMEKCKDIYVKIKGGDSLETARAWNNMGFAYLRRRRVKVNKALEAFQETLRILKLHFGDNDLQVAQGYADVSLAYVRLNDAEKARDACRKALDICRQLQYPETPAASTVYYICSSYYIFSGKPDRAAELLEQAISIREKTCPPGDPLLQTFKLSLKKIKAGKSRPEKD